jgi:hypothetical protein
MDLIRRDAASGSQTALLRCSLASPCKEAHCIHARAAEPPIAKRRREIMRSNNIAQLDAMHKISGA